ncbi:iron ABC transporter permease [Corynebacterium uropygiale]|uniref:Iron ABC transporter permease n=1 Tax=Corynebacterium uropygiale TaxID=1775911 RepID=A0A9X1QQB5_9CORY|nr:iron ABC transporter permease [Corynebacterium uropygiale]MCF4005873.1 iron ABC transporter permease [Corynebacterium uropygiale]
MVQLSVGREKRPAHPGLLLCVCSVLLILVPLLSLRFGSGAVPLHEGAHIVWIKLTGLGDLSAYRPTIVSLIWENRIPRILSAMAVGAVLGLGGVAMQAVIRNPLAEPYVLGMSAGASTGAAAAIVLIGTSAALAVGGMACAGAVLSMICVLWLGSTAGGSSMRLVLAGVAMGFLFTALTNLILSLAPSAETAQAVVFWTLGSLTRPSLRQAALLCVLAVALGLFLWRVGPWLDALASGDDTCLAVGLDPGRTRVAMIIPVSLAVAIAVSLTGGIGFVGLVMPHLLRPLVGSAHRGLVPMVALTSALLLVLADTAARSVLPQGEIPVGVLTALLGAPLLLVLVRRGGDRP